MGNKKIQIEIKIVEDSTKWSLLLDNLETSSTFLKWSWGEYKKKSGWNIQCLEFVSSSSGDILACCLLQSKKKGFLEVNLIQGGVHLSKNNKRKDNYDNIYLVLCDYIKKKKLWLLLINYQAHSFDDATVALMKLGFSPILTNKMFTYLFPRDNFTEANMSLSKNWRHNLKRAQNNTDLKIEWSTSEEERKKIMLNLSVMYKGLTQRKKFKAGIDITHAAEILASDKSMIIVQAKLKDEVVAIRIASVCNDHILDLVAASNEGATKCYANYLLMWEMIKKMAELNRNYFDSGGVEPSANIGVFNFKKGLNGKLALNGPLWCLGSNLFISKFVRMFKN